MKNAAPITDSLFTPIELQELLLAQCSKTIQNEPEVQLLPSLFCQPIDIAIDLSGDQAQAIPNMPGYPLRSPENAIHYISEVLYAGIRTVMLRMTSPRSVPNKTAILEKQAAIVHQICQRYEKDGLTVIVDPFSIALNANKTWGILTNGELDYLKTAALFSEMTKRFATAGASYMLTLGRFEREVDITHRTLTTLRASHTKVASFSTNTETTNAYIYADHGAYAITKQKILVSNYREMAFQALVDIHEGSELVIVKPAENLHILEKIKTLLSHDTVLREFLNSKHVKAMVHQSVYLHRVRRAILESTPAFLEKAARVRLSAYTVSGTYFIDTQTQARKGDVFLRSILYERFCNIAGILSDTVTTGLIIDRNACWFFKQQD